MKKVTSWLCMLLLLCLAGCTAENPESKPIPVPSNVDSLPSIEEWMQSPEYNMPSKESIILGFSQLGTESAWRIANSTSIQDAAKESGITLIIKNAEQSQKKQFEAVRSFIRKRVDVIAIAPVVESGWDDILLEAKQAGIPVIIVDRSVDVQDHSLFVTTIGSDFYEEGVKAGKYIQDRLRNEPGMIRIAELQGTSGSTPSIQRGEGFRSVLGDKGHIIFSHSAPADFTENKGRQVMKDFLQVSEEERPQVLFAHNDEMAFGAIQAIQEAGLKPGEDIVIVSVDGSRKALGILASGKINAVVECNPLLGPQLMQATKEIMAGRTLPKRMVPREDIFTQESAKREMVHRKF
ncbi:MAG: ABC transporter substrate-binding protein [Paenibacillus sp.]|uniref:ABC transporter substrate-binding protein n=1 Tax=Paenibacillus sp. TaxID=58172 RepID=UPI0025E0004E|nr:ABC transporter substrate-binding protein [Paenibacillus sp.]MBR2566174.1 ABC transporter substrate-binding protein [Paenibacillus sp.]